MVRLPASANGDHGIMPPVSLPVMPPPGPAPVMSHIALQTPIHRDSIVTTPTNRPKEVAKVAGASVEEKRTF